MPGKGSPLSLSCCVPADCLCVPVLVRMSRSIVPGSACINGTIVTSKDDTNTIRTGENSGVFDFNEDEVRNSHMNSSDTEPRFGSVGSVAAACCCTPYDMNDK